jgi:deoxyribodipyrimidine photo-lyase
MEKFDKQNEYIKKWVSEFNTSEYPVPIVEHTFARNRCLEKYKEALLKK